MSPAMPAMTRPPSLDHQPRSGPCILPLTAFNDEGLRALADELSVMLETADKAELERIGASLCHHRTQFQRRVSVVGETVKELRENLQAFANGEHRPNTMHNGCAGDAFKCPILVLIEPMTHGRWRSLPSWRKRPKAEASIGSPTNVPVP